MFSGLLLLFSFLAGLLGALTGLGGGVIVIPVLVLLFHINIHYAMGASLISVIANSSGAAASYMRSGYTNLRIGMFLEIVAVLGALLGALLIPFISITWLTIIFSGVLFLSAYLTMSRREQLEKFQASHPMAITFKLDGTYPHQGSIQPYHVQHVPLLLSIMGIAGILSGLLGIGSGILNVVALDQIAKVPYKVATTTSNFMIGITAAVSAGIYLAHGYIQPGIAFPVMLGVIAGSTCGAHLLPKIDSRALRFIFSILICLVGLQMLYNIL